MTVVAINSLSVLNCHGSHARCFSNRKLLGGMARRAAFGAGTDCSAVNDQVALLVWSMELTGIHRELPSGYLLQFSMEAMALIEIDG